MKLNNPAAAQALLRLFNIEISWEQLEEIGPTYYEPMKSIVQMIKYIDQQRAGELITSDPQPEMLEAAYEAGYRLAFTQSKCKCCSKIDSMLHIVKPALESSKESETVLPSRSYERTWKEMKKELYGDIKPTITLKEIGEMIINDLSKKRAWDQNFCTTYKYDLHKDAHQGFLIKKQWKLPSVSQRQLGLVQRLLQESIRETCDKQVNLKLGLRHSDSQGFLFFQTKEYGVSSYTKILILDADITTRSAQQLSEIDFQAILDTFRSKVALLPQESLSPVAASGNIQTKDEYFKRYMWATRQEVAGDHISKAELKEMIEVERAARLAAKP